MNYNLHVNSTDRISGTNNNGVYLVQWEQFLDLKYDKYKINFSLTTDKGYYIDSSNNSYGSCTMVMNTNSRFYSYSTTSKNQSNTIGFLTTTNGFGYIYDRQEYNVPIIIQTPTSNNINISFLNGSSLLVQTDSSGNPLTDMTSWSAIISFSPVVDGNI